MFGSIAPVRLKMDLVVPKHEVLVTEWEFLIIFLHCLLENWYRWDNIESLSIITK